MNWLTSRGAPLLALAALALAGCDKGTDLNVDLPDTAAISTDYQDLPVSAATVRLVPVQTLKTDRFLIGALADNVAGATEARAYFNLLGGGIPDSLPSKFPAATTRLDSVVLLVGFDRVYGSSTAPVRFDVFQLPAPLDERQVYDSGTDTPPGAALRQDVPSRLDRTRQQLVKDAVPGSAAGVTPVVPAVPAVFATVPDPTVRLLLQRSAFAATPTQPLLPAIGTPALEALFARAQQPGFGQAQLDAALKGLAVGPTAGYAGSIVSGGRSRDARLVFYFHADALRRTYSVLFGAANSNAGLAVASDPAYYTRLSNALPGTLAALSSPAGAVPSADLGGASYLQEGVGLGTRIVFQGLADLQKSAREKGLTINRAELRVPVKPFSNALFTNPSQVFAVEVTAANRVLQRVVGFQPHDRVAQADGALPLGVNAPAVGGLVDAGGAQPYYNLLLTSYLQAYLNNQLDGNPDALVLVPNIRSSATLALNRAAIDAANIRLRVYYSKR